MVEKSTNLAVAREVRRQDRNNDQPLPDKASARQAQLPPKLAEPDADRFAAMAAIGFAIKCANSARRALAQRNRSSAQRFAAQAVEALGALTQGRAA